MKGFNIKFRDFNNVNVSLSYYLSGNIKVEIYSGDVRLCELTTDVNSYLHEEIIAVKDTAYTGEFLQMFMQMNFIKCYVPIVKDGAKTYMCGLSMKYPAAGETNVFRQRVAMGGA